MLSKRIIACLDIKNGRTVKGVAFNKLRDAGDPAELARAYSEGGADELVLLDITATLEGRQTFLDVVERVAATVSIPFTVGGGISSLTDVEKLLSRGADKVSVNTAAILDPGLIGRLSRAFGEQCIVLAIDTAPVNGQWKVLSHAGTRETGLDSLEWAQRAVNEGAGEILLTSFPADGTRQGFSLDITARLSKSLQVPVIASGGAGTARHFFDVFSQAGADAALAAGIFHYGELSIASLKTYLAGQGIAIRPVNNKNH